MIYFTSDLHLGHSGIITMQDRPFATVDEMDRVLLTNYNAVVRKMTRYTFSGISVTICGLMPQTR